MPCTNVGDDWDPVLGETLTVPCPPLFLVKNKAMCYALDLEKSVLFFAVLAATHPVRVLCIGSPAGLKIIPSTLYKECCTLHFQRLAAGHSIHTACPNPTPLLPVSSLGI